MCSSCVPSFLARCPGYFVPPKYSARVFAMHKPRTLSANSAHPLKHRYSTTFVPPSATKLPNLTHITPTPKPRSIPPPLICPSYRPRPPNPHPPQAVTTSVLLTVPGLCAAPSARRTLITLLLPGQTRKRRRRAHEHTDSYSTQQSPGRAHHGRGNRTQPLPCPGGTRCSSSKIELGIRRAL